MDKLTLRDNVLEELEFEPSIDAAHVGVISTESGVVTLTGYMPSYAQKLAAEAAARRVRGVHAVANEIEVRYAGRKQTADDEIAERALKILKWDSLVPGDAIQLVVKNGWITLTGEVQWQYQRNAAEQAVRRLSDLTGVMNNITIKPIVQPGDIKAKIEAALKRRAEIEAKNIFVEVRTGGAVVLNGKVDTWQQRQAVDSAAWSAPGVKSVEDRLVTAN